MNKLVMITAILLAMVLVGCSSDKVTVSDHNGRITDLERRMKLNDDLDALQTQAIQANVSAVENERASRLTAEYALSELVAAEAAARIAGDIASADEIASAKVAQTFINGVVQLQLALISSKFPAINAKLSSLQSKLNATNADLNALEAEVNTLNVNLADLQLAQQATESDVTELRNEILDLQSQVDSTGVQVYKCNASNSTERILKINNKFYAVMNLVTTEQVQVVTGSSSTSYTNASLCIKDDKAKLPSPIGICPVSWTKIGGDTVTVPSYTTTSKTVVTSVKMALDPLENGSYQTTDSGPACVFSVNNGSSTNLIQEQ